MAGGSRFHRGSEPSPPPPLPSLPPLSASQGQGPAGRNIRSARERRLLSDLWLISASTFRRLDNLEQARAAIQEAEQLDEENEAVWVQVRHAICSCLQLPIDLYAAAGSLFLSTRRRR